MIKLPFTALFAPFESAPSMQKKNPDEEKPKKLSTYTIKLDDALMEKLRAILEGRGWGEYGGRLCAPVPLSRGPTCNVTAFMRARKVVVAGKGTEDFVLHTLEGEITGAPKLGYDNVLHPDWFESHAGLDESGKGDFFGPVIAATVIGQPSMIEAWIKAGVKDSKKIAESQIIKLDELIRGTHGAVVKTFFCGMPKYNQILSRPGINLNRLLAWQHATCQRWPRPWEKSRFPGASLRPVRPSSRWSNGNWRK